MKALQDDSLVMVKGRLAIVDGDAIKDALNGEPINAPADQRDTIVVNNRIRAALDGAIASLKLVSPDRAERLAAARAVAGDPSDEMLSLIKTAFNKETDDEVKRLLNQARALIEIKSSDAMLRR